MVIGVVKYRRVWLYERVRQALCAFIFSFLVTNLMEQERGVAHDIVNDIFQLEHLRELVLQEPVGEHRQQWLTSLLNSNHHCVLTFGILDRCTRAFS